MPSTTRPLGRAASAPSRPAAGAAGPSSGSGPAAQAIAVGSGRGATGCARLLDGGAPAPLEQERRVVVDRGGERRSRARSRACTCRIGRRPGRCTSGARTSPGGISGSSQSTVITCSSWSDCSRPAAAASKSVRPRAEPITAAQTRGGTGSAVSVTAILGAARADHEGRDLARTSIVTLWTCPVRARIAAPLGARRALVGDDGRSRPSAPTARARCDRRRRRRRSGVRR